MSSAKVRKWLTYHDRELIEYALNEGYELKKIADTIGKTLGCITLELRRAGGRDQYSAEKAQRMADERLHERNSKGIQVRAETKQKQRLAEEQERNRKRLDRMRELDAIIAQNEKRQLKLPLDEKPMPKQRIEPIPAAPLTNSLEERVEALEGQLELLYEEIKSIRRDHEAYFN